jgi:hypothetical protein
VRARSSSAAPHHKRDRHEKSCPTNELSESLVFMCTGMFAIDPHLSPNQKRTRAKLRSPQRRQNRQLGCRLRPFSGIKRCIDSGARLSPSPVTRAQLGTTHCSRRAESFSLVKKQLGEQVEKS